jgi:thioredoxin reductase
MAVETPARIAILGAGPIGLEAALYARFLGYDVDIFERGRVAGNVLGWGHVRMFSPFRLNRSTLGLAALAAQDEHYQPPDDDALLTGRQWAERYLLPLSKTDLLADHIHEQTTVLAVGRDRMLKGDFPGGEGRADQPLRILLRDRDGRERISIADAVIDTTGVYGNPNCLGNAGIPAVGEAVLRPSIEYGLPDVLGTDREHYVGKHTLLIGCGHSAATTVVALSQLAEHAPATRVTWVTRRESSEDSPGPIPLIPNDRLPQRDELGRAANRCARGDGNGAGVTHWPGTFVESIQRDDGSDQFVVELSGQHAGRHTFDRVIANVGFRPDNSIYSELQVHACYASGGPMKLAAALMGQTSADCLDQKPCGPQTLLNPESNFYILGSKSYGRNSKFLVTIGLEQIRELFTIIGDRENLDLYDSVKNLLTTDL